jgi:sulfofructose kinase
MASVVCLGLAVLDHVFTMPGADENARILLAELSEFGVDVSHVRLIPGAQSGVSAILIDQQGERIIVNYADPRLDPDPSWLEEKLTLLKQPNVAALGDLRWQPGTETLLACAKASGLPAVLDADLSPDAFSEGALQAASHALFSEPALLQYAETSDRDAALRSVRQRLGNWVGFTAGAEGTFWLEEGRVQHQQAFPIQPVDTLGAGDVFHGVFALGLAEGLEVPGAIRLASASAALKCSRTGGRSAIPLREEIETFMAQHG